MPEPHLCSDLEQVRILGGGQGARLNAEPLCGTPDEAGVAHRVGSRQEHQLLSRLGQRPGAPQIVVLDMAGDVAGGGKLEAARQLGGAHALRQLQEGERVATRLSEDPVADPVVESAGQRFRQQGARMAVVEPTHVQFRQAVEFVRISRLASGEHDRHRLREQPSRDESEHLAGGAIEPLRVVHETQQGPSLRDRR